MTNSPSSKAKRARPLLTRIPFIDARFPDPDYTSRSLAKRFEEHCKKLRIGRFGAVSTESPGASQAEREELSERVRLSVTDVRKITRRADRLAERHKLSSPMGHMAENDLKRLGLVREGVDLVRIPSEHRADEIAAEVHEEFPWMAPASDTLWKAMRRSVRNGDAGFRLPPLLLDGPPGIGKSRWARFFSERIGTPSVEVDASAESAAFGIVGQEKGWGKAEPGRVVNLILQERIGNPLIIIDEIEKAGVARSESGAAYRLTDAILPLLEPATSKRWNCPYFRLAMNMGWISWVVTSNDAHLLSAPFRSRCVELKLRDLTLAELTAFVLREQARRGLSDDVTAAVIGALEASPRMKRAPSLRTALRLLELAELQDDRPWLH